MSVKGFNSVIELNSHIYTHNKLILYPCSECDYQDPSKDKLKVHMRIHDGRKNYNIVCNVCKKCFQSISELNIHMNTHNMLNMFSCID